MSTEKATELRARADRWWRFTPLLLVPFLFWNGDDGKAAADSPEGAVVVREALGAELPLHVNARVERWMDRFQHEQKPSFERLLTRRGIYAEMIEPKLRQRGLPEELLYLAMMESGLKTRAVSKVSAVGLWQFMSPTAQQYGLRIDEWVDERRDPVRATDAALDYLEWLHDRFGSWYLAAAAYNAGPGTVERVLRRHAEGRRGDEDLYWEVLDHLPRETREYVPRLVAATILSEEPHHFGITIDQADPYVFDEVFVPGSTSLRAVARMVDAEVGVLRDLNPHLLRGVTPPGVVYGVRVPVGESSAVVTSMSRRAVFRADDD